LKNLTKKIDRIPSFPVGPQKPKEKKHTFTKGAYAILARRLAISVFPQPVGPIIRMFFGTISSLSGSGIRCRRHLFPAIQNRNQKQNWQPAEMERRQKSSQFTRIICMDQFENTSQIYTVPTLLQLFVGYDTSAFGCLEGLGDSEQSILH
jgi:hypothetical protein